MSYKYCFVCGKELKKNDQSKALPRKYCSGLCYDKVRSKVLKDIGHKPGKLANRRAREKIIELNKDPIYRKMISDKCRDTTDRHHIDLNPVNNELTNILLLRHKIHASIHKRAYDYLVRTQQIQNYLNWFTVMYKPIIKNTKDGEVWT